jgi:hypothetical protein
MSEQRAKYFLDELSRKNRLLDWFGSMERSVSDRYMLTHAGRKMLVARAVI